MWAMCNTKPVPGPVLNSLPMFFHFILLTTGSSPAPALTNEEMPLPQVTQGGGDGDKAQRQVFLNRAHPSISVPLVR